MIRLHTSRIDPFLCGSVRNPNRSPVSRPAGRIRFRGSAEENPVFPVHNLKIVDDHTAKIDAGEADQFTLRLNRTDRYRDRNNRLLQDSICPHFYCLINANALDFCKLRDGSIKQPAPLLRSNLLRGQQYIVFLTQIKFLLSACRSRLGGVVHQLFFLQDGLRFRHKAVSVRFSKLLRRFSIP